MKTEKFSMNDAVLKIEDIRHIVAIMFGTTDLIEIKNILIKSGYPFGSAETFANQIRDVYNQWLSNGKNIEKVNGYCGMVDPFDTVEKELEQEKCKEIYILMALGKMSLTEIHTLSNNERLYLSRFFKESFDKEQEMQRKMYKKR